MLRSEVSITLAMATSSSSGSSAASRAVVEDGLFCEDWPAREEVQLLETVEEFGYGNWASVADKMGRTAEECSAHYDHCYVNSPHPSLPVLVPVTTPVPSPSILVNNPNDKGGPIAPYYSGQEIGCYMPHRGDFAVEPMNSAERMISDLEVETEEEEDELITALKLAAVKTYCEKVKQRAFRKWLVREYGMIDIRKQAATDKTKLMRNQLAIKKQLRPFMRFMRPQTGFKLLQSLFLAEELKEDIRQLKEYRTNGITTRQGAELCERLQRRRRLQKREHGEVLRNNCTVEESLFSHLVLRRPEEKNIVKEKQAVYEISRLSGVERLTVDEKELCVSCRLHPEALLGYLAMLEGEGQKAGKLRLADARRFLKIDVNKTRKIYNFLVGKGRIR